MDLCAAHASFELVAAVMTALGDAVLKSINFPQIFPWYQNESSTKK